MRTNGKPLANVSHKAPTIGAVRCPSAALGPIAATICPDETGHRGDASASVAMLFERASLAGQKFWPWAEKILGAGS